MEEQYKGHVIRITTERDNAHFRGNQFAKYLMEHRERLLRRSTGSLVTIRLNKPRSRMDNLEKMDYVQKRNHEQAKET